ncbi:unnamed protein product [Cuscuta campestris]|uniref:Uncharacterized protein n=1 Tax=Cuscuta campestris TaxID=132261 RepID=A0A484NDD8_9ASTE|nr:unnamed protein product [Cuscuta campestris]
MIVATTATTTPDGELDSGAVKSFSEIETLQNPAPPTVPANSSDSSPARTTDRFLRRSQLLRQLPAVAVTDFSGDFQSMAVRFGE